MTPDSLEKVCEACGGQTTSKYMSNLKSVYTSKAYDLDRCKNCKLILTAPFPSSHELSAIYRDSYAYDIHNVIENEKKYRAKVVGKLICSLNDGESLFEIGAMHGFQLNELKKYYKCKGIELSSEAVARCQRRGLDVQNLSLEAYLADKKSEKFDSVLLSHVLEHIVDTKSFFSQLGDMLNPNGTVILIVPNSDSILARWFDKYWGYWQVPVHIRHYNSASLETVLKTNGFEVVNRRTYGGDSLMFLSTLANFLGMKSTRKPMSKLMLHVVRIFSAVFKIWIRIGNDDLLVQARLSK